jgi:hypothetical protein
LNAAAIERMIAHISDELVPVVRCLATLGGMCGGTGSELRRHRRDLNRRDMHRTYLL